MAELRDLNEFLSQNSIKDRTIKCHPQGISFERFGDICALPEAPEDVQATLQQPVSVLRNASAADKKTIVSAINSIISSLIANKARFVTLAQYGWLARTTIAAALLTGLPPDESSLVKRLFSCLEEIEQPMYCYQSVIQRVGKYLCEDIPVQGVNLLYVIKKLAIANSQILYYVAVSLVFAGLSAISGLGKSEYRLHSVEEFLNHLDVLNMTQLHRQRHHFQTIYQLLKLLSMYENMVLVRHAGKLEVDLRAEHKWHAEYFSVSVDQLRAFKLWVERASAIVHLIGDDRDIDYLILADLIQVDILPLFDDLGIAGDLNDL